jgi:hypothetical protein
MPSKEKGKENQIKRFILSGDVSDDVQDRDELLYRLGVLLDRYEAAELLAGQIMFEDQDGEYHQITVEAVIRQVAPGQLDLDPWAGAEADLPTGEGVVIKKYLSDGEIDVRGIKTADELLRRANQFLRSYDVHAYVGDVLFEDGNGDHFVVTVEAVMSTPGTDPCGAAASSNGLKR